MVATGLICQQCDWQGTSDSAILTRSGVHVRADCPECGRYIKFVSQTPLQRAAFHFGKYKDVLIVDVAKNDADYLRWALETVRLSSSLREAIVQALKSVDDEQHS